MNIAVSVANYWSGKVSVVTRHLQKKHGWDPDSLAKDFPSSMTEEWMEGSVERIA